ncbi:hypothetical protein AVEN_86776-1 [Araneus ventricosus]|uniref:Uncharacterized protein n=1 Tax=Araneus ventricosus TaxID=182803 RepID=A0A4Y2URL8_ARAVE|nr:hypothetical protein AVEN_86776-1 [Araneus ventricosus]
MEDIGSKDGFQLRGRKRCMEWYSANNEHLYYNTHFVLSVSHKHSLRQVVSLTAVAVTTGYVREAPFRIGGTRRISGVCFILSTSFRLQLISRLLGFAAVTCSFPFEAKCAM